MNALKFRFAKRTDLEEIVRIYNSTIPSRMVTADLNPVSVESRIEWFERHKPEIYPLWIAEYSGKTVGWFSLTAFHQRAAYAATKEISIYLDDSFRGKGFGRQILKHVIKIAPSFNTETLIGLIFQHNSPSIKLFLGEGFEIWGTLPDVANLDGVKRSLTIVGLSLITPS